MKIQNLIAPAFHTNSTIEKATLLEVVQSTKLYVMFITPRSGSTWVAEMAEAGGRLSMPHEWFNDTWIYTEQEVLGCRPPKLAGTSDINEYIRRTVAGHRSPEGIAGVQLSSFQSQMLFELLEDRECAKEAVTFFYLRRRNFVAQAISLHRSVASGRFHSFETDAEARTRFDALGYDAERIEFWMRHLLASEQSFEAQFRSCGVRVLRFFYEDVLADPGRAVDWMYAMITGKAPYGHTPVPGAIKLISDEKNREWEARFRADQQALIPMIEDQRPALIGDLRST